MLQKVDRSVAQRASVQPGSVKAQLERCEAELKRMLATPGEGGLELAQRHAEHVDELLRGLYASAGCDQLETPLLIGAVGGYGRRMLGLQSDVDVCFVTDGAPETLLPVVDRLLYPLWDAGVKVGHQVLALEDVESAADELPMATELLDLRPVAGKLELSSRLRERLYGHVFSGERATAFIERLEQRTRERHERFGDSVYLLEPEVKNGTGGLRDLDFALWAARARFRVTGLYDLVRRGLLSATRATEVDRALEFIWTVRNHLHALAGRKADRLAFTEQEQVARAMRYGARVASAAEAHSLQHTGAMVEAFMSDYYRHARVLTRASEQIIGLAKRRPDQPPPQEKHLGGGIVSCENGVALRSPAQLENDPAVALRLYVTATSRGLPVLSRSRDAISQAASDPDFCTKLRADREASVLFVQLVASHRTSPFPGRSILAELHDVGLLLAMIPEFAPVVGRVHHDIYHVYTVDVHSVAAVERLHALVRGELATEHPLGCRLAAEISNPPMLALAILLHDVGKVIGGHDHAGRGAEMARPILERLGLPPEDVDEACHLILKHLVLYVVAARRDLGDPSTIRDFAREVTGREGLKDLYLLTIADLSTTSPKAMTTWKANMVDALYRATDALLSGNALGEPGGRIARIRAQVHALWPMGTDPQALDEYLDTMPERYLIANTPAEIIAHALMATQPRESPVVATLLPSKLEDVMELCVVTEGRSSQGLCVVAGDRPGLLAAIAAAISGNRLQIQAAQVHSRPLRQGGMQAVDLFFVQVDPDDELSLDERMAKLERDLNAVITGELKPRDLLKRRRSSRLPARPLPAVPTQIVVEHQASSQYTIIEVLTQDRPALLFQLAEALHALGLTIRVAKISTEGTRVIDVFYVTEADGAKVRPGPRADAVRERLLSTLGA